MTEKLKMWLEIIKLAGILVLFLVLAFRPSVLQEWCKSAGFEECNILGTKLTQKQQRAVQRSEQAVAESKVDVARAADQLREITETVSQISSSLSPEQKQQLNQQLAQAKETINSVQHTETQLQQRLEELSSIVQEVASAGNWVVVFGGDKTLEAAQEKIKAARNNGYPDARVYRRQEYFRSIVPFPSREIAQAKLADIRKSLQRDAYIVNLDTWCPSKESHQGYDECLGS